MFHRNRELDHCRFGVGPQYPCEISKFNFNQSTNEIIYLFGVSEGKKEDHALNSQLSCFMLENVLVYGINI